MYCQYLQEHVQSELTKAIAEATIKNPSDPVDFIGNYLLKIVNDDAKDKQLKIIHSSWDEEDKQLELKLKEKEKQKNELKEKIIQKKQENEEFYSNLLNLNSKTEAMQKWVEYISNETKSNSVYIAEPALLKVQDEDTNCMLFNAVSSKNDQFLMNQTFIQSADKGVIFDLLQEENVDEDEDNSDSNDENDSSKDPKDIIKERNKIFIENVLLPNPYKDKLHFFSYPKVGSFLAFKSSIKSYLNNDALGAPLRPQWPRPIEEILAEEADIAVDKDKDDDTDKQTDNNDLKNNEPTDKDKDNDIDENKEEKEDEELVPDPPQTSLSYVISFDTLDSAEYYDENMIKFIDENIGKFEEILTKIDVNEYLKQREFNNNFKLKINEYKDKMKENINKKLDEIQKENESNEECIIVFKKNHYILQSTYSLWSLISNHVMKPTDSIYCRIIAAFIKLFDNNDFKLDIKYDVISISGWNQCIQNLKQISIEKINEFNPNNNEIFDGNIFDKLLNCINIDEIENEEFGIIIHILYKFIDSTCNLYKYIKQQKEKEKDENNNEEKGNADEPKENNVTE